MNLHLIGWAIAAAPLVVLAARTVLAAHRARAAAARSAADLAIINALWNTAGDLTAEQWEAWFRA